MTNFPIPEFATSPNFQPEDVVPVLAWSYVPRRARERQRAAASEVHGKDKRKSNPVPVGKSWTTSTSK